MLKFAAQVKHLEQELADALADGSRAKRQWRAEVVQTTRQMEESLGQAKAGERLLLSASECF